MIEQELIYKIKGIIFDIYNNVPGNWSEANYEEILFDELLRNGYRIERQKEFVIYYKGNMVGLYRTDLIIKDRIVLELKAVPEILPLHQAQTISYLKVTGLPVAMLINFGGAEVYIKVFPNKFLTTKTAKIDINKNKDKNDLIDSSFKKHLNINFDINKLNISDQDKELVNPYLMMSKNILEILGPGYFHQVYRRSFWDELKRHSINFKWIKQVELNYRGKFYAKKDIKFFKINDLLISIVAVDKIDELITRRFVKYVKYCQCKKGLLINFHNTYLDYCIINK